MIATDVLEAIRVDPNIALIREKVKFLHPEKIFLFGSRARGEQRADSDYDILIVLDRPLEPRDKVELFSEVNKRFVGMKVSVEPHIKSLSEMIRYKNQAGSIVRTVWEEGIEI